MSKFDAENYQQRIAFSVEEIAMKLSVMNFPTPAFCLTLGSGLSDLTALMDIQLCIPYQDVGFPIPTAKGHDGELLIGYISGVPVICLSGRTHYYEVAHLPHGISEVVFATHVMASLGIKHCFTTNAVGALNPSYAVGDLMIIKGHIGFFMPNPITGPHLDFGDNPYFPPMHTAYGESYRRLFDQSAKPTGAIIRQGVYVALSGRTYETAPECLALRNLGADAVGMSTVPEIIAATSRGMQTIGVSIITNVIAEDGTNATNHEEVLAALSDPGLRKRIAGTFAEFFRMYAAGWAQQA